MTTIIDREFEFALNRLNRDEKRMMVSLVRETYKRIMLKWPVWTGFSKANNRISITGRTIRRIEPFKGRPDWRIPENKGILASKAKAVEISQLTKLRRVPVNKSSRPRRIIIGNSVNYAGDLGGKARGLIIYEEAAREATAIVSARRNK